MTIVLCREMLTLATAANRPLCVSRMVRLDGPVILLHLLGFFLQTGGSVSSVVLL